MAAVKPEIQAIFNEALACDSEEDRVKYLDEACANQPEVRARVEALLRAHSEAGGFFGGRSEATEFQPISEQPGVQIGPYKLLQQIGEGGMGVVYMAEQKEPVKRRVALKIIKPGMDTRQVIARFEAERQALAIMDHPNIAKVLDAGATESGRPYFVMELVNGLPVTKYCDQQHLTPKERLELFVPICQAVQHAHQKGIIHRDLKPGNILVASYDGQPMPKIIDFGVAKATSQTLTDKTMFTQIGQVVGTLEYMSPEQAERNQLDIDTRSDIYSLGVVLYELLTGQTPFDRRRLRSAAFDEMLRIIREEEPVRPSTKVSTSESLPSIAANRRIEPTRLGNTMRGELDWIVMKAMEKDRSRRYETANGLANDIERYLSDEAVVACPPSTTYRFRKFARRHKLAIGVVLAIAASLVVGLVGTTWQALRAVKAEREAIAFAVEAKAQAKRADKKAKEALSQAAIAGHLAEGDYDLAKQVVLKELDANKETFGAEHPKTLSTMNILAIVYQHLGQDGEAEHLRKQVLKSRIRTLGESNPDSLKSMNNLALGMSLNGKLDEAVAMYREILRIDPANSPALAGLVQTLRSRSSANEKQERYSEVIDDLHEVVGLIREAHAAEEDESWLHSLGWVLVRLGTALAKEGRTEEGLSAYRESLLLWQRLADKHPKIQTYRITVAERYRLLGTTLKSIGKTSDAELAFRKGQAVWEQLVRESPENKTYRFRLGDTNRLLGYMLNHQGECDQALAAFESAVEAAPDHYLSFVALADFRLRAKDETFRNPELAATAAAEAIELKPKAADGHRLLFQARYRLQDWSGALDSMTKAIESGFAVDARTGLQLAICCGHLDKQEQGLTWRRRGVALLQKEGKETDAQLLKLRDQAEQLLEIKRP